MDKDILTRLAAPFSATEVSWRMDSLSNWDKASKCPKDKSKAVRALAFPFVDARVVQGRFDEVVGPGMWKNEYLPSPLGGVLCRISINVGTVDGPCWVGKEDGAAATDVEAIKGGLTDAFKRSAVLWGVGRYLYFHEARWEEIDHSAGGYLKFKKAPTLGGSSSKFELSTSEKKEPVKSEESSDASASKSASASPSPDGGSEKVYLKVPREEKDDAKKLGARWDAEKRMWFVPAGTSLEGFSRWLEETSAVESAPVSAPVISDLPEEGVDSTPTGMTEDEKKRAEGLIAKVASKQATPTLIKSYLNGKGKDQFGDVAKKYILDRIDSAE